MVIQINALADLVEYYSTDSKLLVFKTANLICKFFKKQKVKLTHHWHLMFK